MAIEEKWPNYRRVNRMRLDGISFADIALQFDDTEEHVYSFWNRYHTFKKEQKKKWDADHYKNDSVKRKAYRDAHREEINAKARQDRIDNPEKYKDIYRRRKQRAELSGKPLNDPAYRREYYIANRERLVDYSRRYAEEHSEHVLEKARKYYYDNRDKVLDYHVRYYLEHKQTRIEELIARGVLPEDYNGDNVLSSYALRIKQLLRDNGIKYVTEKYYNDCRDERKLPFDFYLTDLNILIEVDGEQHFYPVKFGGSKQSDDEALSIFNRIKKHDWIKDKYAEKHNIPLIRVPYYLFEEENWRDIIMGEINDYCIANIYSA